MSSNRSGIENATEQEETAQKSSEADAQIKSTEVRSESKTAKE
jgi:hypothetical protein